MERERKMTTERDRESKKPTKVLLPSRVPGRFTRSVTVTGGQIVALPEEALKLSQALPVGDLFDQFAWVREPVLEARRVIRVVAVVVGVERGLADGVDPAFGFVVASFREEENWGQLGGVWDLGVWGGELYWTLEVVYGRIVSSGRP